MKDRPVLHLNVMVPPPRPGTTGVFPAWRQMVGDLEAVGTTALVVNDPGRHPLTADGATAVVADSTTLVASVARVTRRIGLVTSGSARYGQPFNMAREIAGLDHLTGGRTGWHVMPLGNALQDAEFGLDPATPTEARLRRAGEFVDVALGLWDGWAPGAQVPDRASGSWVDTARIHALRHVGEFYLVDGPLDTPRSPQGRPLLFSSPSDRDEEIAFAAGVADVVMPWTASPQDALRTAEALHERAAGAGRPSGSVVVAPVAMTGPHHQAAAQLGRPAGSSWTADRPADLVAQVLDLAATGSVGGITLAGLLGPELLAFVAETARLLETAGVRPPDEDRDGCTLTERLGLTSAPRTTVQV
jgi:alkanesulfonate monooxygenase SsuD/methylene tetrahydromethanopterin reductase-like flavin-dependent oxidoreductase (luciferase family)